MPRCQYASGEGGRSVPSPWAFFEERDAPIGITRADLANYTRSYAPHHPNVAPLEFRFFDERI